MFRRLSVAAAALALLAVGCTGGDDGPAEPDTRTTTGVTDDAVIIRVPEGAEPHAVIGAAARLERTNRDGGVHGRRVVLETEESGDTFAYLPASDASLDPAAGDDDGTSDVVNRPVFGAARTTSFCSVEVAFSVVGCQGQPSTIWGDLVALGEGFDGGDGDAKAMVMALEGSDADLVAASFEAAGFSVTTVGDEAFESVSASVDAVLEVQPDVVVYPDVRPDAPAVAAALRRSGFEGAQTFQSGYTPLFAAPSAEAGLAGVTVLTDFAPFESADENPIVQRMIDDIREYEETEGLGEGPLDGDTAAGYWSADAFLAALDATGSDLTVERFVQTADDDFEWRAEGTAGPATWPRNRRVPVPCGALVEVTNGGAFDVAVGYSCGRNLS